MKRIFLVLIPIFIMISSCDSMLDPQPNSDLTDDDLDLHASYGEGLLGEAYSNVNYSYNIFRSTYTDNAVPATQGLNAIALGSWTVETNPIGNWDNYYNGIKYLNKFLEIGYDLTYEVGAAQQDSLLRSHRIGEAYFLRGWFEWQLLKEYAGYVDGESQAMAFPIVTTVLEKKDNINMARDAYSLAVDQITTDLDSAIARLPLKYDGSGGADAGLYGAGNRGRGSGLAAMAIKSRMYLYAASPSYNESDQQAWDRAAEAAYDAIEQAGGLTNLQPYGNFNDYNSFEDIWIQPTITSNGFEQQYYPPSLYGAGTLNPSQNLVDAFPGKDGYPVDESTFFDENNPYVTRTSRFERFIFHNGEEYNGTTIETFVGGQDAPGGLSQQGTRTGYYLQKHSSNNVRLTPGDETADITFTVMLSKKELYLNFAEAANEAWGPNDARLGFSAADVLAQIRQRAGIDSDETATGYQDAYLQQQAAAGKEAFRDLVHNERRLELSFEGHRFWDTRRWNDPLSHTIHGVRITTGEGMGSRRNVALKSTSSTDYVSSWESIEAINDGNEPQSSTDNSNGKYGNWNSAGEWRYIQYDFSSYPTLDGTNNVFAVNSTDVYWFSDGGGILIPDSTYIEYWDMDAGAWTEVPNPSGYGKAGDQWNTTTFDQVETNSIRLHMKSNTQSTGVIEWQVMGAPQNARIYSFQKEDVETHTYQDYMRYIPIPYDETLIMDNLKQNRGW